MGKTKAKRQRASGDRDQDQARCYTLSATALRSWPEIFRKRRNIYLRVENKSHVEGRAESGELEINDVIRIFMREPEESLGFLPRADRVEEFCFGMSIDSLRKAKYKQDGSLRLIAWLDDRNLQGPLDPSRAHCKLLTVYALFRELKKPRFPSADPHAALPAKARKRPVLTDADRRLVFITDLDCLSIYALVQTASSHQASALREALYYYLDFEPCLKLAAITEGFPMLKFAFHLPFFALRPSKTRQTDCRRDRDGMPLRRSQDVSFLDWQGGASPIYLYDAQISCVIAGSDWSRWVAWLFIDTYYLDAEDESKEDVLEYHEDSLSPKGMRADPLTYGSADADKPIWDPEEYFLTVFKTRFAQATREWKVVVKKFKLSLKHHQGKHEYRLWSPASREPSKDESHNGSLRCSLDWVLQFMRLCKDVKETLAKTVKSYEPFCARGAGNLVGGPRFPRESKLLPSIQDTFDELCQLNQTLDHLLDRCSQYTKELKFKLSLEVVEVGNQQIQMSNRQTNLSLEANRIAEDNKGISWMMMLYVTPVALTSSVFSMQPTP
ncbi:uncharacterized protein A1O5_08411 [Cladophialophora psammophila CBS 110553]|uniref:Uncharacterized protein n=1 Tax=Cladophialophora psammophila CBS 110553 TaxID=1182543 RepID=W9WKC5_9EURO|nr:uncharacterized protein A1O5_08411 [Cladophialophora psammophila CBS 110553]EXJ68617.1 hypothetical protein A1O5_08411 [Cladophialophora psammophila CBS 110553]